MTINELKRLYAVKRREIRTRLSEFARIGRNGTHEALFEELTYCIYTAGASARMGLRSVEGVRPILMTGSKRQIQRSLKSHHRFPNARGAYVWETREYFRERCDLRLREVLDELKDPDQRRDFFAANREVRGLGYKESSHFLRNIGYRGYAILDKHLLGRLAELGVIDNSKPPSTKTRYLVIEERLKQFAESIAIDFDELDLLLWYSKTGEILK
ncbi:MAG TPA: N-glycosylase/DNA lyase [Blastocatellia bacterium]|nr:N-glycosylase/DNA lyase [Blastocatellia bacterium]